MDKNFNSIIEYLEGKLDLYKGLTGELKDKDLLINKGRIQLLNNAFTLIDKGEVYTIEGLKSYLDRKDLIESLETIGDIHFTVGLLEEAESILKYLDKMDLPLTKGKRDIEIRGFDLIKEGPTFLRFGGVVEETMYYRILVMFYSDTEEYLEIRVISDKDYLPVVYTDIGDDGKVLGFNIQTTSYGALEPNRIEEIVEGYNNALDLVKRLEEAFIK